MLPATDIHSKRDSRKTIPVLSRADFLDMFANEYQDGQHVTLLGPTQRGKTTLCFEMLQRVISPSRKCTILAGKPPSRDPVMGNAANKLNLRIIEEWPPDWSPKDKKRNGYVLRPKHNMDDDDATNQELQRQFSRALRDNYKSKKPVIVVADEGYHVSYDLKLQPKMDSIHMRGAPVVGLWVLLQRGRFVSYHTYSAPEHMLIGNDPDKSNRRRYAEIGGGIDPHELEEITAQLKTYTVETGPNRKGTISEFLYLPRATNDMYIVDVA